MTGESLDTAARALASSASRRTALAALLGLGAAAANGAPATANGFCICLNFCWMTCNDHNRHHCHRCHHKHRACQHRCHH